MGIKNTKQAIRLYDYLHKDQIRRNRIALRSAKEGLFWGPLLSIVNAVIIYVAPNKIPNVLSLQYVPINIGIILTPTVLTVGLYIKQRLVSRRENESRMFYLAEGQVESIGFASFKGLAKRYTLTVAKRIVLQATGELTDLGIAERLSLIAGTHTFFNTKEIPMVNSTLIFVCSKNWKYGVPIRLVDI